MKRYFALFEYLPLLLFFVAYRYLDIFYASAVLLVATTLLSVAKRIWIGPLSRIGWTQLGFVWLGAGLTLLFRDARFLQWKPSILYGLTALALAASLFKKPPLLQRLLEKTITLPPAAWFQLTLLWSSFCAVCSYLNYYVAFKQPLFQTWVTYKTVGAPLLLLLFSICSFSYFLLRSKGGPL